MKRRTDSTTYFKRSRPPLLSTWWRFRLDQPAGAGRTGCGEAPCELGRIGASLAELTPALSQVQREIRRLIVAFAAFGAVCCVVVLLVYGLARGEWLAGLLAGVTLAMSLLPEEFTVVLTVFLALGAWRMSRHHVLVRRVPALENLGAATILCVDKTGTLTQNRMALVELRADGQTWRDGGDAATSAPPMASTR